MPPEQRTNGNTSPPAAMVEKHYRSLLKAVSWRATGTVDTILISFLVTGQIKLAMSIGFVELFTKVGLLRARAHLEQDPFGPDQAPGGLRDLIAIRHLPLTLGDWLSRPL